MREHTIVVRFPAGVTPEYSAATEFQGGQIVAVDFGGNRLRIEQDAVDVLEAIEHALSNGHIASDVLDENSLLRDQLRETILKAKEA